MNRLLMIALLAATFAACSESAPTTPGTLGGTVSLKSELAKQVDPNAVLYIIARKEVGPPLAVKRVAQPKFPLTYSLSQADAMLPGSQLQGEVKLTARLDKDGNAGPLQTGDMTGAVVGTVPVGKSNADITIDTLIP